MIEINSFLRFRLISIFIVTMLYLKQAFIFRPNRCHTTNFLNFRNSHDQFLFWNLKYKTKFEKNIHSIINVHQNIQYYKHFIECKIIVYLQLCFAHSLMQCNAILYNVQCILCYVLYQFQ